MCISERALYENTGSDVSWVFLYVRETKQQPSQRVEVRIVSKTVDSSTGPFESEDAARYRLGLSTFGVFLARCRGQCE